MDYQFLQELPQFPYTQKNPARRFPNLSMPLTSIVARCARYAQPHRTNFIHLLINKQTKMPKVKTNSGAKKRFALTGTGKIKRHHAYHSHILTKKTKKQKRNLDHVAIVDGTNVKQVRELLCMR